MQINKVNGTSFYDNWNISTLCKVNVPKSQKNDNNEK